MSDAFSTASFQSSCCTLHNAADIILGFSTTGACSAICMAHLTPAKASGEEVPKVGHPPLVPGKFSLQPAPKRVSAKETHPHARPGSSLEFAPKVPNPTPLRSMWDYQGPVFHQLAPILSEFLDFVFKKTEGVTQGQKAEKDFPHANRLRFPTCAGISRGLPNWTYLFSSQPHLIQLILTRQIPVPLLWGLQSVRSAYDDTAGWTQRRNQTSDRFPCACVNVSSPLRRRPLRVP